MKKTKNTILEVHGTSVAILSGKDGDYISLTDMLKAKTVSFSSRIVCATATRWNSSASGNPCSTRVLIMANSP
jgi:hypothetical protein